ncbi:ribose-5-phosphate isomerase RpiA [Camelliibacillus cellulosilyticus]|uniref:Ribose-5-phosphate isomerase A n=1 Tax=Camelliibacillus cellulosilyticus TaxID=2174486 RepID=A0ABV9GQJ8_9BACL
MDQQTIQKQRVGEAACAMIEDGMTVGLGTGSTVHFTILKLGERLKQEKLNIRAVSTSKRTTELARSLNIPIYDLNDVPIIDLTIDGVDEFDRALNGIKGGGGALLFEKNVAAASKINIWVADATKRVQQLGAFPLPVEILPFSAVHTIKILEKAGLSPTMRKRDGGTPYITDSGHWIVDLHLGVIKHPKKLSEWLNGLPGVIENGLFLNIADKVIVADGEGIDTIER